jgi:hypothetical protein
MDKKRNPDQLQNSQQGQRNINDINENTSSTKGMNREAEDELLTTGGPVDRSAVENEDQAVVAQTGGMSMANEEANTSKNDFIPKPRKKGRSARYGKPEQGIQGVASANPVEDGDTSQDKTEGIINPRTTISDWAKWKDAPKKGDESSQ